MNTSHSLLALAIAGIAFNVNGAEAAANWSDQCAKCHGVDGKGETKMGKKLGIIDLTDSNAQAKFTDAEAFKAVKEGVKDKDGRLAMKPIEGLNDDDIKALISYVRSLAKK